MNKANMLVCICETHKQVERAVCGMQAAEIDMRLLSIVTNDIVSDRDHGDSYHTGDQTFNILGVGHLLVSGPLTSWIVAAFDDGVGANGLSVLGSALAMLGISPDSIHQYEEALRAGRYLLIVHGPPVAIAMTLQVVGGTTHCSHTVHGETVFDTYHKDNQIESPAYTYQA